MKNKINLVELLKDCPSGMELECTSYDNVSFDKISDDKRTPYPILCYITDEEGNRNSISFTENGCESKRYGAKCVIFPKDKKTWEGFIPFRKFKAGDVLVSETGNIVLFSHIDSENIVYYHCIIPTYGSFRIEENTSVGVGKYYDCILANEQQKRKMYDKIKYSGYKYNQSINKLEKLVKPKFKVGDRIKCVYNNNQYDIKELTNAHYTLVEVEYKFKYTEPIINDKDWELVPNKFDINTLKTFDQVLVRLTNNCVWMPKFFSHLDNKNVKYYPFVTTDNMGYPQCVPYKGNEHLCRTINDCDEFYRVWEE